MRIECWLARSPLSSSRRLDGGMRRFSSRVALCGRMSFCSARDEMSAGKRRPRFPATGGGVTACETFDHAPHLQNPVNPASALRLRKRKSPVRLSGRGPAGCESNAGNKMKSTSFTPTASTRIPKASAASAMASSPYSAAPPLDRSSASLRNSAIHASSVSSSHTSGRWMGSGKRAFVTMPPTMAEKPSNDASRAPGLEMFCVPFVPFVSHFLSLFVPFGHCRQFCWYLVQDLNLKQTD